MLIFNTGGCQQLDNVIKIFLVHPVLILNERSSVVAGEMSDGVSGDCRQWCWLWPLIISVQCHSVMTTPPFRCHHCQVNKELLHLPAKIIAWDHCRQMPVNSACSLNPKNLCGESSSLSQVWLLYWSGWSHHSRLQTPAHHRDRGDPRQVWPGQHWDDIIQQRIKPGGASETQEEEEQGELTLSV